MTPFTLRRLVLCLILLCFSIVVSISLFATTPATLIRFVNPFSNTKQVKPPVNETAWANVLTELDSCQFENILVDELIKSPLTIVTGYYFFNRSEHKPEEYDRWFKGLFSGVQTPMIVFTDKVSYDRLHSMRSTVQFEPETKAVRNGFQHTVFIVHELWDYSLSRAFRTSYNDYQFPIDPHQNIPNIPYINYPEHFAIWNLKPWILQQASRCNPFDSEYFFWVDAGSFRTPPETEKFTKWPDVDRTRAIFQAEDHSNRMLISLISEPPGDVLQTWTEKNGPFWVLGGVQGGFFGSNKGVIAWWVREYYRLFRKWHDEGHFVGREEAVMSGFALLARDRHMMIDATDGFCASQWFFFQQYMAKSDERVPDCPQTLRPLRKWNAYLPDHVTTESEFNRIDYPV